jgi:hypothetical protein
MRGMNSLVLDMVSSPAVAPMPHDSRYVDSDGPAHGRDLATDALRLSARLPFGAKSEKPHAPFGNPLADLLKGRSGEV